MTTTGSTAPVTDPFAGIRPRVPTRYAPGDTSEPYAGHGRSDVWLPVIYYAAGEVVKGEGPIWLVEPYPAARADGTDGLDPVTSASVTVVRGGARPAPRGEDPLGDWVMPRKSPIADIAYEVSVDNHRDLMAAWCEAYAIASALNNGTVAGLGLVPGDIDLLLAAEQGRLYRTGSAFRCRPLSQGFYVRPHSVPEIMRVEDRLVGIDGLGVIESGNQTATRVPYRLTAYGAGLLAVIRRQYKGPACCRVCGCTEERACPGGCVWVPNPELADLCSNCPADDPAAAMR